LRDGPAAFLFYSGRRPPTGTILRLETQPGVRDEALGTRGKGQKMVRVLIGFLAILLVLSLVRFVWRMVTGWVRFLRAGTGPGVAGPSEPRMVPRELRKDPQCGMYVSPELSIRSRYRGEELHFCSRECKEKFFQVQSEKSA